MRVNKDKKTFQWCYECDKVKSNNKIKLKFSLPFFLCEDCLEDLHGKIGDYLQKRRMRESEEAIK